MSKPAKLAFAAHFPISLVRLWNIGITSMKARILSFVLHCFLGILYAGTYAAAGPITPITGVGFAENQLAFAAQITHGAITTTEDHQVTTIHPKGRFWTLIVRWTEADAQGIFTDTLDFTIVSRHRVGVPDHPGEVGNPEARRFHIGALSGYEAGKLNHHQITPPPRDHKPLRGHKDFWFATLDFLVADDAKNILSYDLKITGVHCPNGVGTSRQAAQEEETCPVPPPIEQGGLREIPEPATRLLLATGCAGLLGYGWLRRHRAAWRFSGHSCTLRRRRSWSGTSSLELQELGTVWHKDL